jgi:hypothetical protein
MGARRNVINVIAGGGWVAGGAKYGDGRPAGGEHDGHGGGHAEREPARPAAAGGAQADQGEFGGQLAPPVLPGTWVLAAADDVRLDDRQRRSHRARFGGGQGFRREVRDRGQLIDAQATSLT